MNGELHLRVGVLDAERGAVTSELAERAHVVPGDATWIDLDAVLGGVAKLEPRMNRIAEPPDHRRRRNVGVPPPKCICATRRSALSSRCISVSSLPR